MKRSSALFFLSMLLVFTAPFLNAQPPQRLSFAWLSDIHFNSFAYAEDDIRQAIEDINNMDSILFTVISGDLAEFGTTDEFLNLKKLLDKCEKPYFLITGNHDVNWSENGCTAYEKIFGAAHFIHDIAGVRLIGCGAGPMLRMGAPCIPREEIEWLKRTVEATDKSTPIIFINHFPMDKGVTNSTEAIGLLKTKNIQAVLCGHEHRNATRYFNGVENIIGRSLLRRKDPIGGYNIVTLFGNDSLTVAERITKDITKPVWHSVVFHEPGVFPDTAEYQISYAINALYPQVKREWVREEPSDIASQGSIDGNFYVYTTTSGKVCALDAVTGKELWHFQTGNKIFSAPFITKSRVYVSSCDGCIYALGREKGEEIWSYNTGYPIVACPIVQNKVLYIGSSNGKFYALNVSTGKPIWISEGLKGYIESRPAVDKKSVYIGTWGAHFYAFDKKTGQKQWEFDTGKGRYFSPGACWPQIVNKEVFIQSSDYMMRAFSPNGEIVWQTSEPKGREAIGFSSDFKTLYIQGIGKNVTAYDLSKKGGSFSGQKGAKMGEYSKIWTTEMPYESNFIPTRPVVVGNELLIASAFGVVYAIDTNGNGVTWQHKLSNSAITSFAPTANGGVIVMTMDGKIARLAIE